MQAWLSLYILTCFRQESQVSFYICFMEPIHKAFVIDFFLLPIGGREEELSLSEIPISFKPKDNGSRRRNGLVSLPEGELALVQSLISELSNQITIRENLYILLSVNLNIVLL